jgi:hypothetical protein
MIRVLLVGLLILALALCGCAPLTGGEQDNHKPEGEVLTEPYDSDGADPYLGEQDAHNDELSEDFECEIVPLLNNEVLFKLTNHSEAYIQQLTMHTEFCDEQDSSITDFEYYFKGVAAGQVLYAFSTHLKQYEIDPGNCRITYKIDRSEPGYVNATEDIEIEDDIREGSNYTIVVTLVNTGSETIDYVNAFMLFYYEDELTGASERFAQDTAPGGSAELSFMPTMDAGGSMIPYDSYEVVVSQAYYKK